MTRSIHHVDGNPNNNDPSNLRVVDQGENKRPPYTAGPWRVQKNRATITINGGVGEQRVCSIGISVVDHLNARRIADANLIAAAPYLLETLESIASFAVGYGDVCEIIAQRARAAIFKATDRQ